MRLPTESPESYQRAISMIDHIVQKYGIDEREKWLFVQLYDDHYWLVQKCKKLIEDLEKMSDSNPRELPEIKPYDGRQGLSALIPATYKPMNRPLNCLREVMEDES